MFLLYLSVFFDLEPAFCDSHHWVGVGYLLCHAAQKYSYTHLRCSLWISGTVKLLSKGIFARETVNISHCTTGSIPETSPRFFLNLFIFDLGQPRIGHHNPGFTRQHTVYMKRCKEASFSSFWTLWNSTIFHNMSKNFLFSSTNNDSLFLLAPQTRATFI